MKNFLFTLLLALVSLSCSTEENARLSSCECELETWSYTDTVLLGSTTSTEPVMTDTYPIDGTCEDDGVETYYNSEITSIPSGGYLITYIYQVKNCE